MEHTERIAERLRTLARELLQLADGLAEPEHQPVFPASAKKRIEDGLCLICDSRWVKRGLCDKHYQRIDRRIKKDPTIEASLVELGKIAPKAGRLPVDSLQEALQALAKDEITKDRAGKRGK